MSAQIVLLDNITTKNIRRIVPIALLAHFKMRQGPIAACFVVLVLIRTRAEKRFALFVHWANFKGRKIPLNATHVLKVPTATIMEVLLVLFVLLGVTAKISAQRHPINACLVPQEHSIPTVDPRIALPVVQVPTILNQEA